MNTIILKSITQAHLLTQPGTTWPSMFVASRGDRQAFAKGTGESLLPSGTGEETVCVISWRTKD
jgi:hypothetical protein